MDLLTCEINSKSEYEGNTVNIHPLGEVKYADL